MTTGRTLKEKIATLPKARRSRIEARAAELVAEELSLRALRKALNQTQVELAKIMGVGQDAVSRYEQRSDLMLSTLSRYVSALGGTLSIVAEFPNKKPIRVRAFGSVPRPRRQTRREQTTRSRR
jgi:DNA-binding transcriptional regulator YiaG